MDNTLGLQILSVVKDYCRRESKRTYVKTFEFSCSHLTTEEFDKAINEWIVENHVTIVSIQHSIHAYATGSYATYVVFFHK